MSSFTANMVAIVVSLIAAAATAAAAYRAPGRLRNAIKVDAEIAALLPASPIKARLMEHIDRQISRMIEDETEKTRDVFMLTVALLALAMLIFATVRLIAYDALWSYGAAAATGFVALIFMYGVTETAQKAKRDDKGVRVE